ncbi:hypothetical protein [Bacillus ndiopicus]|uniref:hypothetical protein n=1 Tax=Bacillus ndiopicus TaxID=1347368 RepID=UPI0005AAFB48|nr:hypothetical protein [Bacillus ndiopicus]
MGRADMYDLCCQYHGKRVRITERDGRIHEGRITRVDRRMVWLEPDGGFGGYRLGFWGFGFRPGFGVGIALGAIAGIALAPLFFW